MAVKTESRVGGFFDQAVETFGETLKAGVKMQEEVGKFWTGAIDKVGPVGDWQKKSRAIANEAIPAAQKNAEEWVKLVEQNYRRSMALLKKAFDRENLDPSEAREKTQKLWEESLELIRDNAQAMTQANIKMLELWSGVLKKNAETVAAAR